MTQELAGSITQMLWRPKLIKLTHIAYEDSFDGKETTCYIDPQNIVYMRKLMTTCEYSDERKVKIPCTGIMVTQNHYLYVMESPEQIALLRDKAFGFDIELKAV